MRRAQTWRTNRARTLRINPTKAEDLVRSELPSRQLGGFKFIRQAPIGPFFVDFLCREQKLAIEIDGTIHSTDDEIKRDQSRTAFLRRAGYCVFRAHNVEIFANLSGVLNTLLALLEERDL